MAVPSPFNPEIDPALYGDFEVTLKDGTKHKMAPVWQHWDALCAEFPPSRAAEITGVPEEQIRKAALTYATRIDPSTGYGNGGIQYGLAPEHACNAIDNNRIFDIIVGMTGNWDTPAGNRGPSLGLYRGVDDAQPTIASGHGPEDGDLTYFPNKILGSEKMPMLSWWQQWADCNAVLDAMIDADPYPVRGGLGLGLPAGVVYPTPEQLFDRTIEPTGMKWEEYREAFQEHGWWDCRAINPEVWGTYRRYETGMCSAESVVGTTPAGNPMKGMSTPTRKMEIWSTAIETFMPGKDMELPNWKPAPETELANPDIVKEWPYLMTTGRRIPVYFHSEHRQLPWCRELWPAPRVEINPADAAKMGIEQGDWVWIESPRAKVRQVADLYYGVAEGVINCEHQWWFPELDQADKGYGLSTINCLVEGENQDPLCGASNLRAYNVKVYKDTPENSPFGNPCPCGEDGTEIIHDASDPRLKAWEPDYSKREEA